MKITTSMVKELRAVTGAGVLEAKKTLESFDGDFDKAVSALQEKGAIRAAERAEREATEGVVEVYAHHGSRVGVLLEVNCETDFVARNEKFQTLAHDLALHVAAMQPKYVSKENVPESLLNEKKEHWRTLAMAEGKPPEIADRIVNGRLEKFFGDVCLLEQSFVKDDDVKVADLVADAIRTLGENVVVRRFARFELGEEL